MAIKNEYRITDDTRGANPIHVKDSSDGQAILLSQPIPLGNGGNTIRIGSKQQWMELAEVVDKHYGD